jgi:hypothetical protein
MSFHQLFEDPDYDDLGQLVDEDELEEFIDPETYDPFDTVNS